MSAADLKTYVSAPAADEAFVTTCWAEATALVTKHVGEAVVPAAILKRATLEVGSELFHRRQAPHGVAQFSTPDSSPVRIARDPMVGAYPLLQPYVGLGFA